MLKGKRTSHITPETIWLQKIEKLQKEYEQAVEDFIAAKTRRYQTMMKLRAALKEFTRRESNS